VTREQVARLLPHEKLAGSLTALHVLQRGGRRVIRSADLSRGNRERLLANGFLQEVMKGWLISTSPGARVGDSTPWYASFLEVRGAACLLPIGQRLDVRVHSPVDGISRDPSPRALRGPALDESRLRRCVHLGLHT
jgi:hypothetical protein